MNLEADATRVVPGRPSPVVLRVTNDRPVPVAFRISTIGLADDWVDPPSTTPPVAPGATAEVTFSVHLPVGFPSSRHLVGVVAEPVGGGAALRADLVLEVGGRLGLQADLAPRDIRGGDDGRFTVSLVNDAKAPATVELEGVAPEGRLKVVVPAGPIEVGPGESVQLRGRVKGRRPLAGQSRRLPFAVRAVGSGPRLHLEGSFTQTPVFSSGVLRVLSVVTVLALWLSAIGVGLSKLNADDDDDGLASERAGEVDGEGGDGDGDGSGQDGEDGGDGDDGDDAGDGAEGAGGTKIGGTVDAAEPAGVVVRVEPVQITDEDTVGATFVSRPPASAGKRGPGAVPLQGDRHQTVTDESGQYAIAGLRAPAFYLVTFSKPGYSSRSYVVEAKEDGEPIALDVLLEAGPGTVSGVVVDVDGRPLGGASVTVTDGTVTLQTTTATTGDGIGQFEVAGLTTPGSFLVSATRSGFGTESTLVELDGSGSASGIVLRLHAGVGSLTGRVFAGGSPVGGINVTVSGQGISRTSTTLTDDPVGSYAIPQLPIPGEYTVEVAGGGYATSTQRIEVDGNEVLDIELQPTLGRIYGRTFDQDLVPLAGVGVTLRSETATFKTTSVDDPVGAYELEGIPAGTYVATYERFGYTSATQTVTVGPGASEEADATLVELEDHGVVANASIVGTVTSPTGPVTGTVEIVGTGREVTIDALGGFRFDQLPAGVYNLRVDAARHEVGSSRTILAQASTATVEIELTPWASASGIVRSGSAQGPVLGGAIVVLTNTATDYEAKTTTEPDGTFSLEHELPAGTYRVDITEPDHIPYSVSTLTVAPGSNVELAPVLSFKQVLEVRVHRYENNDVFNNARVTVEDLMTGEVREGTVVRPTDGSNPEGIVRFAGLEANHYYWVYASAPNYFSVGTVVFARNNTVSPLYFTLFPGFGVNGRVEWDDSGTNVPIDGATLSISGIFGFDGSGAAISEVRTVDVDDGAFSLQEEHLPIQGDAVITVTHPDFGTRTLDPVNLRTGGMTPGPLNPILLEPLPGSATGTLEFAPQAPADLDDLDISIVQKPSAAGDITVDAELDTATGEVALTVRDDSVSDADDLLRPGNYRLRFTHPDHVDVEASFRVEPNDATTFEAELERRGSITARVRATPNGMTPANHTIQVAGAQVQLLGATGNTVLATATTGTSGNASFADLAPGTYRLRVTAPSHQPEDANPSTPGVIDPVTVVVNPGGSPSPLVPMIAYGRMVGNVKAKEGNGTIDLGVDVTVTATLTAGGATRTWQAVDPAGADGYTMVGSADTSNPGLLNGTLQIGVSQSGSANVPGYSQPSINATVDTSTGNLLGRCGSATDRCDIVLDPLPGGLQGRVVNEAGQGINGVTVTATRSDGSVVRTETTVNCPTSAGGGAGCYGYENAANNTFDDLVHGTYTLRFERTGYKVKEVSPITVQRGEVSQVATQTLVSSSTTLEVEVVAIYDPSEDALPVTSGMQVGLYQNGQLESELLSVDNQGRVTFADLEDGETYQIRAVGTGFGLRNGQQWPTVTTAGGTVSRTVTVTALPKKLRVTVRSEVEDANGQILVPGATVDITPNAQTSPNRPSVEGLVTDSNGRVEADLPPGQYTISVDGSTTADGHLDASGNVTVSVTSPNTINRTVDIQEALVTGTITVVDGEGPTTTTAVRVTLDADGSASDRSRFFELVSGTATVSMYAAPTTYTLTAAVEASNSHTTARQEGLVLAAGDVETVALTILRLGNLKVAVVDADGNPVDAKVTLVDPDGIVASRSSDTQGGAVVFIAVRPQQWRVTATHTDGREGEATYTLPPGHEAAADYDVRVTVTVPETTTTSTTTTSTTSTSTTTPDG